LTAMESFVAIDELEPGPVRKAKAARRGRGAAAGRPLVLAGGGLMRAASWLRDGRGGWRDFESVIVVDGRERVGALPPSLTRR
jgi:hypothetical protein